MKKLFSFKRARYANTERARMARSMPGETAALASVRLGGMSL